MTTSTLPGSARGQPAQSNGALGSKGSLGPGLSISWVPSSPRVASSGSGVVIESSRRLPWRFSCTWSSRPSWWQTYRVRWSRWSRHPSRPAPPQRQSHAPLRRVLSRHIIVFHPPGSTPGDTRSSSASSESPATTSSQRRRRVRERRQAGPSRTPRRTPDAGDGQVDMTFRARTCSCSGSPNRVAELAPCSVRPRGPGDRDRAWLRFADTLGILQAPTYPAARGRNSRDRLARAAAGPAVGPAVGPGLGRAAFQVR